MVNGKHGMGLCFLFCFCFLGGHSLTTIADPSSAGSGLAISALCRDSLV